MKALLIGILIASAAVLAYGQAGDSPDSAPDSDQVPYLQADQDNDYAEVMQSEFDDEDAVARVMTLGIMRELLGSEQATAQFSFGNLFRAVRKFCKTPTGRFLIRKGLKYVGYKRG